ncbi:MAG: nuclear transport factor 2 family protein, partial [Nitrosopumilales archaeon]
MKTLNTTIIYYLAITILVASCSTSSKNSNQLNNYSPGSTGLYDTIVQMDSILFNAFNTRDFDKLKTFFSEDLEFYHDLGGLTNYPQNLDAFKKTFESDRKVRREVVACSLEVYPIKDYGSVEIGIHRFYVTEKGQKEKLG